MEMPMKITNCTGTGDRGCSCGSWLDHWKKFSKQAVPTYCPAKDCYNKELLGAHVTIEGQSGQWILPLCGDCNKKTGAFEYGDSYTPVSANKSETCEKKTGAAGGRF
jgi:hypothetical protein